jgi:hypothetical protein
MSICHKETKRTNVVVPEQVAQGDANSNSNGSKQTLHDSDQRELVFVSGE